MTDYDCTIEYHPGKANVLADALSRKSRLSKSALCSFVERAKEFQGSYDCREFRELASSISD